jgi:hypothetical protein
MFAGRPGHPFRCIFPKYPSLDDETSHRIVVLLLILGTLFLLDIVTTQIILRMGGIEMNPLMAGIVANPPLHLGIKAAILLLIFSISLIAEQRVKGSSAVFYCVLITLYVFVVINNLFVILPQISM